jgi:hypothetical protein
VIKEIRMMRKVDCYYYDEEINCCGALSDYSKMPCGLVPCTDDKCGMKEPRPLLQMPTQNGKYIKLGEPKVNYDEITCSYKIINEIYTQICNMVEKNIIDTVIAYARKNDVVDLIIIDEKFVRNALKHEEQRQQKPKTNFDKITSSVEALAEFIETISIKDISKERIVQWLKEPDDD